MNQGSEKLSLKVGVLAIIGSFIEHVNVTSRAAKELHARCEKLWSNTEVEIITVRTADQVDDSLDALIVPGGETTVISKFIGRNNFVDHLKSWMAKSTKFVWGTCAGLIIFSNQIESGGSKPIVSIGGLDITCERNGFGRQRESHVINIEVGNPRVRNPFGDGYDVNLESMPFSGVFLRAPVIKSIDSKNVEVLCTRSELVDLSSDAHPGTQTEPVGVLQDNKMATTFHPELTDDIRWHAFFLQQALARKYSYL